MSASHEGRFHLSARLYSNVKTSTNAIPVLPSFPRTMAVWGAGGKSMTMAASRSFAGGTVLAMIAACWVLRQLSLLATTAPLRS